MVLSAGHPGIHLCGVEPGLFWDTYVHTIADDVLAPSVARPSATWNWRYMINGNKNASIMLSLREGYQFNDFSPADHVCWIEQHDHLTQCGPIWWHKSGSTLVKTIACYLTAPTRCLKQYWLYNQYGPLVFIWEQFHKIYPSHQSLKLDAKMSFRYS